MSGVIVWNIPGHVQYTCRSRSFAIRAAASNTTHKKPSVRAWLQKNIAMGGRLLLFLPWLLLLLSSHAVTAFRFTVDDFPDGFAFGAGTAAFQVP